MLRNAREKDWDKLVDARGTAEALMVTTAPRVKKDPAGAKTSAGTRAFAATKASADEGLHDILKHLKIETFTDRLFYYMNEKQLDSQTVYKNANVSRKYFSKIISNKVKSPSRETVIALAIGLKLNMQEMKDLLSHAGYAISVHNRFDVVISYFIEKEKYDIWTIYNILFKEGLPQLGSAI